MPPLPPFRLAQAIFEPNIFLYKYCNKFNSVILPAYIAYEDGTDCSETLAHNVQMLVNHPKERIHHEVFYRIKGKIQQLPKLRI